jgi:Domain of unknown function (DUF4157)/DNA/RNA non-specific endonuclease
MPESTAEQNKSQTPARADEPARQTPEQSQSTQGGGHGGVYSHFREIAAASGSAEPPPARFSMLLRKSEYAHPVNDAQRGRLVGALQQQYGNRYVQRVLAPQGRSAAVPAQSAPVQRSASVDAAETASPQDGPTGQHVQDGPVAQLEHSAGRSLDQPTQSFMGSRLGHDFSAVRVHDDGHAQAAAKSLGAEAFTTGRDIYFNQGAYQPSSESGQRLLAHELTHVVQQDRGMTGMGPHGYTVSRPSDPLEREAEQVSRSILRGEMFPAVGSASGPVLQRQAGAGSGGAAPPSAPAPSPARAAAPPPATAPTASRRVGDFLINIAGESVALPLRELRDVLERATPGGRVTVPDRVLRRVRLPVFRINEAALDLNEDKEPRSATVGLTFDVPPLEGRGTATVDRDGRAQGSVHVVFSSRRIPGIRQTEMDVRVGPNELAFDANLDFDLPRVRGNLKYKYDKRKHSGKGKAQYEGSKLKGGIEIIMSEAGRLSGGGQLEMELFKGLRGNVDVAVDEERNVRVTGELRVPGQVELFPEKKYERSFFNFEKKFPLWGITVPVVDVNVGLFAEIHAGAGFRAKFGPGVLRDIALTGQFGTDPETATEFGLGGEFFVPAGAEIVVNVGGGIGLGLAIADITGGLEAVGVAGLYTALTVRPQFRYTGGKYVVSGTAELAGVAQVKFGINAFAKIDVGVWLFKGTVWRKNWTLAEWVWNTGLNIALRANVNYTLGEDFAPDINFETGQVDPEKLVRDVMPESGSPVPAPPKPPVPDRGAFNAEGAQGTQATEAAPATAPAPPTPATPQATTQRGVAPGTGQPPPGEPGAGDAAQAHDQQVAAGLAAIDQEETKYLANNEISKEDAEKVAAKIKHDFPVFKSIIVVDGGKTWNYNYVASPGDSKVGPEKKALPKTRVRFTPGPGSNSTEVFAAPLTKIAGDTTGSDTKRAPDFPPVWPRVTSFDPDGTYWGRLHLLGRHIHGPGNRVENIVPGRKSANAIMEDKYETPAARMVKEQDEILWYRVRVKYRPDPDQDFPEVINVSFGRWEVSPTDPTQGSEIDTVAEEQPLNPGTPSPMTAARKPVISEDGRPRIFTAARGAGVTQDMAHALTQIRPLLKWEDIETKIKERGVPREIANLQALKEAIYTHRVIKIKADDPD